MSRVVMINTNKEQSVLLFKGKNICSVLFFPEHCEKSWFCLRRQQRFHSSSNAFIFLLTPWII